MENKICVYTICKNESKFVKRWYESMKEADYIAVLDTGSTDNTVELLKEVGVDRVEVKEINPWRFDVARNESLKLVPEEYNILVCTDLDEVFEPGWADILRKGWKDYHERAEYKYTWSHKPDGSDGETFMYNKIHNRDWHWVAPVHEYLGKGKKDSTVYWNKLNLYDRIHLHHYPDSTKSRSSYLKLIELRAEEQPDDYMGKIYLAREYWFYNMYSKCIEVSKDILDNYSEYYIPIELAYTNHMIGECSKALYCNTEDLIEQKELFSNAMNAYKNGIEADNAYIDNYVGLGDLYNRTEDYAGALFVLKQGIKKGKRRYHFLEHSTNWSSKLCDALAIASFGKGDHLSAIAYSALAMKYDPKDKCVVNNFNVCINSISNKDDLL